MYYQKKVNPELWCEPGFFVSKFENPEMKVEKEYKNVLDENQGIDVTPRNGKGKGILEH